MNDIIEKLGIQFADDTSRGNLIQFHKGLSEGNAERPILVLAGMPASRKNELAYLLMGMGDMEYGAEIVETFDAGCVRAIIDADLLKECDIIEDSARIIASAAGQPYAALRPTYAVITKTAWFSLTEDQESRALRVDLLPALETAGIGEVS